MRLKVFGVYDDCPEPRTITSSTNGTTYESSNASIASVDEEGWVTPHADGEASVLIRNGDVTAKAGVKVRRFPEKPPQSGGRKR